MLSHLRHHLSLPSVLLLYLLAVVVVAAVGGLWAALATAVVSFLVVNWFFTPPLHAFTIGETENLLALFVFLAVATIVSGFVSLAARRAADGRRAHAEAQVLAALAGESTVQALLDRVRAAFQASAWARPPSAALRAASATKPLTTWRRRGRRRGRAGSRPRRS